MKDDTTVFFDMRYNAALNTATSHEKNYSDTMSTKCGPISLKSLRRQKHYKELNAEVIDIYL